MPMDRDSGRLIYRKLDGGDSDEVPMNFALSVEDRGCYEQWWAVDPERGLIFHRTWGPASPQCNSDENVSRLLASKLYPWADVVQVPFVRYTAHDDGRVRVTTVEPSGPRTRTLL